jgi:restriction system protein
LALRGNFYFSGISKSGPDGGYDFGLRKDGKLYLVQCKHWKAQKVGVAPVRELFGVIAARGAAGGFFVTSGCFTEDAKAFATQTKLKLIDGLMLKKLIAEVARTKPATATQVKQAAPIVSMAPDCPKCGAEMVRRIARKGVSAGKEFWGCSTFPACRGVINA